SMNGSVNVITEDNGNANKGDDFVWDVDLNDFEWEVEPDNIEVKDSHAVEDDVWAVGKDETAYGDGSIGMVHLRSRPLVFGDNNGRWER
ncbi:11368_t:CDS:1, partial [Paraglomus occultum]